jgi:3-methyladenine DNA glycosylase Tag
MVTNRKIYKVLNGANNMEKKNESTSQDRVNAILFGNDVKEEYNEDAVIIKDTFKITLENMINNAKTIEDLNAIGAKFNEAIDNKYKIDDQTLWDYQLKAAKKMIQIYNKWS